MKIDNRNFFQPIINQAWKQAQITPLPTKLNLDSPSEFLRQISWPKTTFYQYTYCRSINKYYKHPFGPRDLWLRTLDPQGIIGKIAISNVLLSKFFPGIETYLIEIYQTYRWDEMLPRDSFYFSNEDLDQLIKEEVPQFTLGYKLPNSQTLIFPFCAQRDIISYRQFEIWSSIQELQWVVSPTFSSPETIESLKVFAFPRLATSRKYLFQIFCNNQIYYKASEVIKRELANHETAYFLYSDWQINHNEISRQKLIEVYGPGIFDYFKPTPVYEAISN